jgi:hypothetical protein
MLGGAAVAPVAWPLATRAQQPAKLPIIGALVIGNTDPGQFWREFRQALRDRGYVEGQNIRFEFRSAEGQVNRLPELAAELVRLKDVIVAWFTPAGSGGTASNARNPDRHGRDGRSHRHGAGREPSSAGRKCHRDRQRNRRTGRQKCPTDPRHAAVRVLRGRSGQCDRSLLQAFPRTDPAWRSSHRNDDQRYQNQQ